MISKNPERPIKLFLSSGIIRDSDYTMEQMVEVAQCLREDHKFAGYIHLKTIPDTSPELMAAAGRYADRLSINVELPTESGLTQLAPKKRHVLLGVPSGRQVMSDRQSAGAWSIEEFAASVLGGSSRHKAVAVIGYFDESGTSAADPVAMYGGMVARASDWAAIEGEWRAKLAEFGLSEYHAAHCEEGKKEFDRFQKPIRDCLTNYFSSLASRVHGHAFGSSIGYKAWQDLVPEKIRENYGGDPLFFTAANLMQLISMWSAQHNDGEPVALVFATHSKNDSVLAQLFADLAESGQWPGLGSIIFGKPKLLIPLQVADLICYELKRQLTHSGEPRKARINFKDTRRMGMHFYGFDDTNLPSLVEKWAKLYPSLI